MVMITINWKFLCDLILLIEGILGILWSLLFIIILIQHRLYKKSPLALLVGNASLAGLLFHSIIFVQSFHMLIGHPESQCVLRGHLIHSFAGAVYHSICLQALHRLFVTVLSNRRRLQNRKVLLVMIIIQWTFSLTFCLPKLNPYPMISDICLGPFHRRYVFIHLAIAVYFLPIIFLIIIYSLIFRYIKEKTSPHILQSLSNKHRLHREVSILRRIIIPVVIMLVTGLPLASFFVQGQFSLKTPESAVRIGMIFLTAGTSLAMLMNLIFTDSVRERLLSHKYSLIPIKSRKKRRIAMYQLESTSQSISINEIKNYTSDRV
jgi:hypothetical protein